MFADSSVSWLIVDAMRTKRKKSQERKLTFLLSCKKVNKIV